MKGRLGFYVIQSLPFIAIPSIAVIPGVFCIWLGISPLKFRDFFVDLLGGMIGIAGIVGIVWFAAALLHLKDLAIRRMG